MDAKDGTIFSSFKKRSSHVKLTLKTRIECIKRWGSEPYHESGALQDKSDAHLLLFFILILTAASSCAMALALWLLRCVL